MSKKEESKIVAWALILVAIIVALIVLFAQKQ